jgi:hypothetical protein
LWDLTNYLFQLASNLNPPDFSLLSDSWVTHTEWTSHPGF